MYHYIRDLKYSKYPRINGLDVNLFREQIEYILKYYNVIRMEDLIDSIRYKKNIPNNSLLLTFDDAYKDHFDFVFPILDEFNIQGSFFTPVEAIENNKVLDVNKIHFILASQKNKNDIINRIHFLIDKYAKKYSLNSIEYYNDLLMDELSKFDTKEVVYIKKMLQRVLPEEVRNIIVNILFNEYVSDDESMFSKELYMSIDQLKCLKRNGMYIGGHGYGHYWLNTLNKEQQEREVLLSKKFLKKIGCLDEYFTFCYPYGAFDDSLLDILKKNDCKLALTTKVNVADLNNNLLTLSRLDTNDLPKDKNSKMNNWTSYIMDIKND